MQVKKRVLIVDDHVRNVDILKKIVGEEYTVRTASSGEQALEIAPKFLPDVILLDIMMPGIDGYETCRRLREISSVAYAKIIIVSAKSLVEERVEAYESAADDYITKPFDNQELMAKVRVFTKLKSIEELHRLKSDYLALLAHETRTPLNGIVAPAELLLADDTLVEDQRELAETILHSAKQLLRLCEKATQMSELKSESADWDFQSVEMCSDVTIPAAKALESWAKSKKVRIVLQTEQPVHAWVDKNQMQFVAEALLHNAIRFSSSGSAVVVEVLSEKDNACLKVIDQGDGIDPEFLPRVFDEFTDPAVLHHSVGTGLSLAMCRQIAAAHEGTIEVESTVGLGSTFTVVIPTHARVASGSTA